MDNLTKEQRRLNMQSIRSSNTSPELSVKELLKNRKIHFKQNDPKLIGKPDFVFWRKKVVLFIDSVFWHAHPKKFVMPKSNVEYLQKKIARNKERDRLVNKTLKSEGWLVLRIWDYDIKHNLNKVIARIERALNL